MLRLSLFVISAALVATSASAQDPRARIGTLGCDIPTFSVRPPIIINKPITVQCTFVSLQGGRPRELYEARINVQSPILIPIQGSTLKWAVHAGVPATVAVLSGGYSSGLESDPIANGLGQELLIGGAGNLVVLQPGDPSFALISIITTVELEFLRCEPSGDGC